MHNSPAARRNSFCSNFRAVLVVFVLLSDFSSIEANFGDDKDKPFHYDIKKCPGMGLDCI
jgi:hypothetical protein